jgi:leader peptidase (prepilin peptidase) / N-methyltransferase
MILFFAAIAGLILGSFFNVVICRLPKNESLLWPASHCPQCKTPLKPWHNIPVFSYLFLKGRCHSCKKAISPVYPVIELTTCFATCVLWQFYIMPQLPLQWYQIVHLSVVSLFLLLLIPITVIDFRHYIIPDSITLSTLALAAVISFLPGTPTPLNCLFGILAGGGTLYAIGWIGAVLFKKGEAMGGGDIKMMAAAGALWGPKVAFLGMLLGAFTGSFYGIAVMISRKLNSEHQIPFGPFLGAGIWAGILFGDAIINWYLGIAGIR